MANGANGCSNVSNACVNDVNGCTDECANGSLAPPLAKMGDGVECDRSRVRSPGLLLVFLYLRATSKSIQNTHTIIC